MGSVAGGPVARASAVRSQVQHVREAPVEISRYPEARRWWVSASLPQRLPAQVGQDRQDPAVIFRRGQKGELAEQVPDVGLDGFG